MGDALIIAAARTPLGPAGTGPAEATLLAAALRQALADSRATATALDQVILGRPAGQPTGPRDPAWAAVFAAGLPLSLPAWTVDRGGLSGLQALGAGALAVASGHHDLVVVLALSGARIVGRPPQAAVAWRSSELDPDQARALLQEADPDLDPDIAAAWPARSRQRWQPPPRLAPLPDRAVDQPAAVVDGAVAFVLASPAAVEQHDLQPLARILGHWAVASDPAWRLLGPARAARSALQASSLRADQLDQLSLEERDPLALDAGARLLGLDADRLNPRGGALARGHAGAAEGALQLLELLEGLEQQGGRLGLVAAAGEDGQAMAVIVDREFFA